jgi:hypothetical protein
MLPLLLGLWLIAPASASALEVRFTDFVDTGLVVAIDSSPVTLELVRGGMVLDTAGPGRTARAPASLQAGDVARVTLDGGEVRTFTWEGLPALDADICASLGQQTLTGSFPAGATLDGSIDNGEYPVAFSVEGTRFTAHLPLPLTAGQILSIGARRTEGQTLVDYRFSIGEVCPSAVPPPPEIARLDFSGKRLRNVPVDRHGRFELHTRAHCPPELPTCRVSVGARVRTRSGSEGRSLGAVIYSVPGGTRQRLHGKIGRRALAALRRTGRRNVFFSAVIRKPVELPEGIAFGPDLHTRYSGALLAP